MSRSLCASVASSFLLLLLVVAPARADECPVKLADMVGAEAIARLTDQTLATMIEQAGGAVLGPTPEAIIRTSHNNIATGVRSSWQRPVRGRHTVYADAYAGPDYTSSSPDVFILPGGARAVCHMIPGVTVFLSDGSTFHYTVVAAVDYEKQTITLADPWAGVSFLRKGFNQAGIAAETVTIAGKTGLSLTFDEFATVFRGQIDATADVARFSPTITFDTLAAIYPEIASSEAFHFWRTSRMLAGLDTNEVAPIVGELVHRSDLDTKPLLFELANAASILLAIRTNFGLFVNPLDGQVDVVANLPDADRDASISAIRSKTINDLPRIAKILPAVTRLRMLEDVVQTDDLELQLELAQAFALAYPDDVEWALDEARALLMLERVPEAQAVLTRARQLWTASVQAQIDVPADQAVEWFGKHSPSFGTVSFYLLHWQRARLSLLEAVADPTLVSGEERDWWGTLGRGYVVGGTYGIANDFLEESLWIAWRRGNATLERELIAAGIEGGAGDIAWEPFMAGAVLAHATWRHGMKDLLGEEWDRARSSFLKPELCGRIAASPMLPRATDPAYLSRQAEIAAFCAP